MSFKRIWSAVFKPRETLAVVPWSQVIKLETEVGIFSSQVEVSGKHGTVSPVRVPRLNQEGVVLQTSEPEFRKKKLSEIKENTQQHKIYSQ